MSSITNKNIDPSLKFVYSDNNSLSVIFHDNDLLMGVVGEFNKNLQELEKVTNCSLYSRGNSILIKSNPENNEILKNYNKLNLFQYLSSDEKNFNQLLDNFDINYDIEDNLKGLLSNNLSISDFCKYEKDINISNLLNLILFELKQLCLSINSPTNSNFSLLKPYFKNTPLKNIIQIILYAIGKIFKSYA